MYYEVITFLKLINGAKIAFMESEYSLPYSQTIPQILIPYVSKNPF
jgi:hypothetical protein